MKKAFESCTPRGNLGDGHKVWWNGDIDKLIKRRNEASKKAHESEEARRIWIDLCYTTRKTIRKAKEEHWRDFIQETGCETNPSKIFRAIRGMSEEDKPTIHDHVLKENNTTYSNDKGKARLFTRKYADVSKVKRDKSWDKKIKREVFDKLKKACTNCLGNHTGICSEITKYEVKEAINELPKGKALGINGWYNEMLSNLSEDNLERVRTTLNLSWNQKATPKAWKIAILSPFLRKVKNPANGSRITLSPSHPALRNLWKELLKTGLFSS